MVFEAARLVGSCLAANQGLLGEVREANLCVLVLVVLDTLELSNNLVMTVTDLVADFGLR